MRYTVIVWQTHKTLGKYKGEEEATGIRGNAKGAFSTF